MPYKATIKAGLKDVVVGGRGPFQGGDIVLLTDEGYSSLNPAAFLVIFEAIPVAVSGSAQIVASRVISGDVTVPSTTGAWALLSGVPELAINASLGDWVELSMAGMRSQTANAFTDFAVVTGAGPTVRRYLSTGTSTPLAEGDPAWYPATGFLTSTGPRGFTVTANDLDAGQVRFRVAIKAGGAGIIYASAAYPWYWHAKRYPA